MHSSLFLSFFSPEALSLASDRNFQKITNNFGKVLTNERKLQADMHKMANMMKTQLSAEQEIEKKLLSSRISAHFQTVRDIYVDSLQSLLSSIELPSEFLLIRNLVSNRDFCQNLFCYRNSYFTVSDDIITAHTQRHSIALTQKKLITCQLQQTNNKPTISIYHNAIVTKKNEIFTPDNKKLPSFNVSGFHIHKMQRKLTDLDLLDQNIILLHKNDQVAFQCVQPAILRLDGASYDCLPTTINWQQPPNVAINTATGHTILHADKMKSVHSYWTLKNLDSPIPVDKLIVIPKEQKLSERINTYFQRTDPLRASLISGLTLLTIAIIALPFLVRCCCPHVFTVCQPITRMRKWYYRRKLVGKANRALQHERVATSDIIDPSAPKLQDLLEKINLLQNQMKINNP